MYINAFKPIIVTRNLFFVTVFLFGMVHLPNFYFHPIGYVDSVNKTCDHISLYILSTSLTLTKKR